jgi:[ribosomal protein S18]-alanine N-acetyltransferase
MNIRPMVVGDLPRVAELERLVNPRPWMESSLRPFAHPSETLPRQLGWVVEPGTGATVSGYACAVVTGAEAELLIVGVEERFRRRGFGKGLLLQCCRDLREHNVDSVFLELRRGNAPALALYESAGFRSVGVRKGYYADTGEDAVQMRMDL